jgi:hypothetical protein
LLRARKQKYLEFEGECLFQVSFTCSKQQDDLTCLDSCIFYLVSRKRIILHAQRVNIERVNNMAFHVHLFCRFNACDVVRISCVTNTISPQRRDDNVPIFLVKPIEEIREEYNQRLEEIRNDMPAS